MDNQSKNHHLINGGHDAGFELRLYHLEVEIIGEHETHYFLRPLFILLQKKYPFDNHPINGHFKGVKKRARAFIIL